MKAQVSSLYQAVDLSQEIPPLLIGERANAHGSKKFRELLLAEGVKRIESLAIVDSLEDNTIHIKED